MGVVGIGDTGLFRAWVWGTPVLFGGWLNYCLGFAPISFRELPLIEDSFIDSNRRAGN